MFPIRYTFVQTRFSCKLRFCKLLKLFYFYCIFQLIQFSVWQSKTTGRTHILTFDSSDKKGKQSSTPSLGKNIGNTSGRRSLIAGGTIGANNKNFNHNQIVSERLDRLRSKYDKEASKKIIGEPGSCFIPLASKRRNSVVRLAKPSAAVLPMKMAAEVKILR